MSDHKDSPAQDPNQDLPEKYEIELVWEIDAFLPERKNDLAKKDIKTMSERLVPSMFKSLESTKQYWSVPERLLDIRILMLFRDSLIREQFRNLDEDLIPNLRRIQFELYIIVSKFAEWCFTLAEADRQLSSGKNRITDNRQKSIGQLCSAFTACYGSDALSEKHLDADYKQENSGEYHSILEKLADYTCKKINESFRLEFETSPERLLEKLEKHSNALCIDIITKKELRKYFGNDPSRCVALLMFLPENQPENQDLQHEHQSEKKKFDQYIAFSGFLDCEDEDLRKKINLDQKWHNRELKLTGIFRDISELYHANLVTLNSDIVNRMIAYRVNEDFSLRKSLTLRNAVNEAQNVDIEDKKKSKRYYSSVKKDYSCCERKILAEDLSKQTSENAMLLVTFQPCLNCYGALKAWKRKRGIKKLSVKYIPPKYLVAD